MFRLFLQNLRYRWQEWRQPKPLYVDLDKVNRHVLF